MTAADRIACDTTAVDAATNDSEVENAIQRRPPGVRQFILAILLSFSSKSQRNTKATEKVTIL
jgi:flagellar basal body-associated protein FliL